MSETTNICPYPGLRPFTEEESIYFKGRDTHIQEITALLEEKNFLMLTGASGDGKSSLVYAGLIPNARAGFFKAEFNNWRITDFKPERTPLKNMAKAVSHALEMEPEHVEQELGFGFSALVDLYKNSKFYQAQNDPSWQSLSEEEQKKEKRKCANLFILVDQFEEFFTNPENYAKGQPSVESQNVINIILETSKIAKEQGLPIYIICTMRSDFIGQCAAFRNLPEFIGYSHFFVPRLKRKEIRQVIEEPAVLSGNSISPRLIEALINSLTEGFDQLPLLQHALHQIWNAASKGDEEMDMIHFAMVGGMPSKFLPAEQKSRFEIWLKDVPESSRPFFEKHGLGNVLDLHADELYESAHQHYVDTYKDESFSQEDSKFIIQRTFQALTKIDDGRGVRNRMTLQEITSIINDENITSQKVGRLINLYRIQGNTFISPFVDEGDEPGDLPKDTVLDITHEALIRNWTRLHDLAIKEDESHHTFTDFKQQLDRWIKNEKGRGYLLSIGPLNYFETWYEDQQPNKYWLAKYNEEKLSYEEKVKESDAILEDAESFLKKSARKNLIGRTVLRYGAERIMSVMGMIAIILACTYYYLDYKDKQNENVLEYIQERGGELLSSKYPQKETKANFIILSEFENPGTFNQKLDKLPDSMAISVGIEMLDQLVNKNTGEKAVHPMVDELYEYVDSKIEIDLHKPNSSVNITNLNLLLNIDMCLMVYDSVNWDPDKFSQHLSWAYSIVDEKINGETDSIVNNYQFYRVMSCIFYYREFCENDPEALLSKISPFEDGTEYFERNHQKDKLLEMRSYGGLNTSHNGGYYLLSLFYAGVNDELFERSLDSLFTHDKDFLDNTFEWQNIGYFYAKRKRQLPNTYFSRIAEHQEVEIELVRDRFFYNTILRKDIWIWDDEEYATYYTWKRAYFENDLILELIDQHLEIENLQAESDHKNFKIANIMKVLGEFYGYLGNMDSSLTYFSKFEDYYNKINHEFLSKKYEGPEGFTNSGDFTASQILLNPRVVQLHRVYDWDVSRGSMIALPDKPFIFMDYLISSNIEFQGEKSNFEDQLNIRIYRMKDNMIYLSDTSVVIETFKKIKLLGDNLDLALDTNFVNWSINLMMRNEDYPIDTAFVFTETYLKGSLSSEGYAKTAKLREWMAFKAETNSFEEVMSYMKFIEEDYNKRNALVIVIEGLLENEKYKYLFDYVREMFRSSELKGRFPLLFLKSLGRIGGKFLIDDSYDRIRNIDDKRKPFALKYFIQGLVLNDELYTAVSSISSQSSYDTELDLYNTILNTRVRMQDGINVEGWKDFLRDLENRWGWMKLEDQEGSGGIFFF